MINIEDIKAMSVKERLDLIEAIWQTLDEDAIQEDKDEIALLEERYNDYKANPDKTISWEDFKERMINKLNEKK